MIFTKEDHFFMQQALLLAWAIKGTTAPNPAVGAVLVKNNKIISFGYTKPFGGSHAERMALQNLSCEEAQNSTLYVSLEPCCFYGKTPPCTDIIIEKKVKRVVFAVQDPHPKVAGKGKEILKQAGILVEEGLLKDKAFAINQDFFIYATQNRPMVTLKYAQTLDGKMATLTGHSQWITNTRSRFLTHLLRYRCDAILVGVGTIIADNPTLNARLYQKEKALLRIVLDPYGKTPLLSKVLTDNLPTLFVVKNNVPKNFLKAILTHKKEVWIDSLEKDEIDLQGLLQFLAKKSITSLFVEGGSATLGFFLKEKLADLIFIFMGDQILGEGLSPFLGQKIEKMNQAVKLENIKQKKLGTNTLIYGKPVFAQKGEKNAT